MAFVFSPSNTQLFLQCPRKFFGEKISKELPYQASAQKSRGAAVHELLDKSSRKLTRHADIAKDGMVFPNYVDDVLDYLRQCVERDGYKLYTEHEMCVTKEGKSVDWWDEKGFMRCKADVLLVPEDKGKPIIIGDWKTGRMWPNNHGWQLRMEALIAHLVFEIPSASYSYWYVDAGKDDSGYVDFSKGTADVKDILDTMQDMRLAIRDNNFPARQNKFCRWCPWHKTKECGL